MRTVLYILTVVAVVALAFWSYRENYETRQALNEADEVRREIRAAHARLGFAGRVGLSEPPGPFAGSGRV